MKPHAAIHHVSHRFHRDPSQVSSRWFQISRWHTEFRIRAATRLGTLLGSVSMLTLEMLARSGQRWSRFANPKLVAALTCVAFLLNACGGGGGSKELAVLHGQDARLQTGASELAEGGDGDGDGDGDIGAPNALGVKGNALTLSKQVSIVTETDTPTLSTDGSVGNEGTTSYQVINLEGRYPGTFSGARVQHSFDDWGYWATQGFETLFKAYNSGSVENGSFYTLHIEGIPTGNNPVSGSLVSDFLTSADFR